MNKVLILVGILAFAGAAVAWFIPKGEAAPPAAPPAEEKGHEAAPAPDPHAGHHHGCDHGHGKDPGGKDPAGDHAATVPALAGTLVPSGELGYRAALGRDAAPIPPGAPSAAALAWNPPTAGTAEVLVRSTLGGMSAQRHFSASWSVLEDGSLAFRDCGRSGKALAGLGLTARLDKGIWKTAGSEDKAITASVLDIARAIYALRSARAPEGKVLIGGQLRLAGEPWRAWREDAGAWLLVGPDIDMKLPAESYPSKADAWNDLRIVVGEGGAWTAAERVTGSPSTAAEPGFIVRRVLLGFATP